MGSLSSKDRVEVPESMLVGFDINRELYFWIILVVSTLALIGNLLAIRTVIFSKYKYLQKTCIISLAVSDLMTVILFAMNNLPLLKVKLMIWIYGEFLCHFIPIGQVLGNLTSSLALLVIALDRYHNVIHALRPKWNPKPYFCLVGTTVLWLVCAGLSCPVVTFYMFIPILVNGMESALCTAVPLTKPTIFLYYLCMTSAFFMPILALFFWFYYKIALLIWRHRKPLGEDYNSNPEITETSCSSKPTESGTVGNKGPNHKKQNVQMQRKIRSFKIVVALVVAFVICRLPYWLYFLSQRFDIFDRNVMWNTRFIAIALHLLNCALNPLLYTYLSFTITLCRKIGNFISNICCCCFSDSEFEDFETRKHEAERIVKEEKDGNNNKIKVQFIDVPPLRYNQRII